jgi:hypothetical protein
MSLAARKSALNFEVWECNNLKATEGQANCLIGIEFRSFRIRRFHGKLLETRANTKVKSTSDNTAKSSLLKPIAEPSQEPSWVPRQHQSQVVNSRWYSHENRAKSRARANSKIKSTADDTAKSSMLKLRAEPSRAKSRVECWDNTKAKKWYSQVEMSQELSQEPS